MKARMLNWYFNEARNEYDSAPLGFKIVWTELGHYAFHISNQIASRVSFDDAKKACQDKAQEVLNYHERSLLILAEPAPIADIGPITPEALEAAGWERKTPVHITHHFAPNQSRFSIVKSSDEGWGMVDWDTRMGIPLKNLKTMEQLHQLLEMMGVGQ